MCQFNQSILFVLFLPVLIFAIPKPIEIDTSSSSTHIGHFKTLSHEVSGELHATDDESVLEIKNFNYDGMYGIRFMLYLPAPLTNRSSVKCVIKKTFLFFIQIK